MKDECFIRGAIPMTKSEVRAVSVSKLELKPDSILYDVGAGTGSVSVEAALNLPMGQVYAFEQKEEGCELIKKNAEKFGLFNVHVIPGKAPDTFLNLPAPDCAFIGGSGGKMKPVLDAVFEKNPKVQVVINVIALESLGEVMDYCRETNRNPEVVSIQVSRAEVRGKYHLMTGQNPVYVITLEGEKKKKTEENPRKKIPRILITAPSSGSGKTVITAGLLSILKKRGMKVMSFKCGPDYIDPMFHRYVLGVPGYNLDSFFLEKEQVKELFLEKASQSDMAVIEGAMGYYDGVGGTSLMASAWEIGNITKTPAILVVDGKGSSLSIAAQVKGFLEYQKDSRIAGVILNKTSPEMMKRLKPFLEELGIKCFGAVPVCEEAKLESRHLGLTIPQEQEKLCFRMEKLEEVLEKNLDIDGICRLAFDAEELDEKKADEKENKAEKESKKSRRLAVAFDEAFCFYYQENLEFLEKNGWELVPFSPLKEEKLPENIKGILLGGGYPEIYAADLSKNKSMRKAIKKAAEEGVKILAECGGFLYLHESLEGEDGIFYPMCGVMLGNGFRKGRLGRFGYISLERNNCDNSEQIRGHEFHYWESTNPGTDFRAKKPAGGRQWDCMTASDTILAGFPHLYYLSNPQWILDFLNREEFL